MQLGKSNSFQFAEIELNAAVNSDCLSNVAVYGEFFTVLIGWYQNNRFDIFVGKSATVFIESRNLSRKIKIVIR